MWLQLLRALSPGASGTGGNLQHREAIGKRDERGAFVFWDDFEDDDNGNPDLRDLAGWDLPGWRIRARSTAAGLSNRKKRTTQRPDNG